MKKYVLIIGAAIALAAVSTAAYAAYEACQYTGNVAYEVKGNCVKFQNNNSYPVDVYYETTGSCAETDLHLWLPANSGWIAGKCGCSTGKATNVKVVRCPTN